MFQRQIAKQSLSGSIVDLKIDNVNFSHEDLKVLFVTESSCWIVFKWTPDYILFQSAFNVSTFSSDKRHVFICWFFISDLFHVTFRHGILMMIMMH